MRLAIASRSTIRLALLPLACLGGCASIRPAAPPWMPEPRERAAAEEGAAARPSPTPLPPGEWTLDAVLRAAEASHPAVAAARDEVRAASGRAWQAGLHPNPSVEIEREGPAEGGAWERSTLKLGLRQPIVLSDRRDLAVKSGLADRRTRELGVDDVKREVRAAARRAFLDAVHLRDAAAHHREMLAVAGELLDLAKARVESGVAIAAEALKPELEVLALRSTLAALERRRDGARDRLAALLGGTAVPMDRIVRPAPRGGRDPKALARAAMDANPRLLVARQEVEAARARLALAGAARRPDMDARVAVGRDLESNLFLAEVSVEVPFALFDAGQGAEMEARALLSKARRDVEALEREIAADLASLLGDAAAAASQLRDLRERILPLAERTLAATREASAVGSAEFLDLLDAQRTLLDARAAVLALEREEALVDAAILDLTGERP